VGDDAPRVDTASLCSLVARVRAVAPDEAYVFTSSHQSPLPLALALRLADVPWIGANSVDHPGSLLDLRRRPVPSLHEVQQNLALVVAGTGLVAGTDELRIRDVPRVDVGLPDGYVVLHPGASVPARGIPARTAGAAAEELVRRGRHVVLTGHPGQTDLDEAAGHAGVIDLTGMLSFAELADIVRRADAVVCGNTGPAHLAAAVRTPVVSVYAPVVPLHQWRPWRVPQVVLGEQTIACAGCRSRRCPERAQHCITGVTGADLADAVDSLVARRAQGAVR
jgi:ADP-heptose:LPS heptosyltransferase